MNYPIFAPAMTPSEKQKVGFFSKLLMKKTRWTDKEIQYVLKHYKRKETNWKVMLQKVHHSREAIVQKAGYLELSRKQTKWCDVLPALKCGASL
ncbi:MAG: hypothetical protein COV47_04870 [Candidatus Diapherotrites archaeon CG11_big_fil_rev_8_21_14_0_20_37_9]|nr:MAG: hypothetical protein COV47_04870 [Candidatus Diapherotrites archaeon CG11_big_fil_rev_8_21_14_0_20_37_9]